MNILILGASSDIGVALANEFTRRGDTVTLASRNPQGKEIRFDALNFEGHLAWFNGLELPDVTICLFGYLGDQKKAQQDWNESKKIIDSNYTGAVSILNVVAEKYRSLGKGMIVGFSSVAGERGRQSNFIYGSAKAGFTAYLSGLRNSLYPAGVHVMTVKPGFMYTKMTKGLQLPASLTAKPEAVAKKVIGAIDSKKNVVYIMGIWRLIMFVIRSIPEFIFKRMKL
ncbi:MAG: SDR family oxidoreductase [Bacteroidota bacterium]